MSGQGDGLGSPPAEPQGQPGFTSGDKKVWLGAALVLVVTLVAGIVFLGSGDEDSDNGGLQHADGVLVEVQEDHIRLRLSRPIDGQDELDLEVQESDRAALNLIHLQLHANASLPTRIYYEREGDDYVARGAVDLPALP